MAEDFRRLKISETPSATTHSRRKKIQNQHQEEDISEDRRIQKHHYHQNCSRRKAMSTSRQLADWNKTWPKVGENYTITQIYWTHYPNQCPICRQQVTADTVAEARLQTCQKAIEGVGENLKKGSLQTSQKGINPIFNVVHLSAVNMVICNGSQFVIVFIMCVANHLDKLMP